ncbi:MAG: hypothetical protein KAH44_05885, partial [Oricola sp.]|nr:hypothetical protein [Oricola sp.]
SGLDRLLFTGGIGANSPEIRAQICEGLSYLGIDIDDHRNFAQESVISKVESPVRIEAVKTDEELAIARHTQGLLDASLEKAKEQPNG